MYHLSATVSLVWDLSAFKYLGCWCFRRDNGAIWSEDLSTAYSQISGTAIAFFLPYLLFSLLPTPFDHPPLFPIPPSRQLSPLFHSSSVFLLFVFTPHQCIRHTKMDLSTFDDTYQTCELCVRSWRSCNWFHHSWCCLPRVRCSTSTTSVV